MKQINIAIDEEWLDKLRLLAVKKSQETNRSCSAHDLIREALGEHYKLATLNLRVVEYVPEVLGYPESDM